MSRHAHASPKESSATLPLKQTKSNLLQRKCDCGGSSSMAGGCQNCKEKSLGLQRKAAGHDQTHHDIPPIVHEVMRSSGRPLDDATRAFMEPRFGHDFSQVRIHTDSKAADSARAVNALAYTVGRNLVFGEGQYEPNSSAGRRLMAHELAHVVQQQGSGTEVTPQTRLEMDHPKDAAEQEADALANRITAAPSAGTTLSTPDSFRPVRAGTIQCTPAPPSHGGVTGVRDLNKIRIDAVADFVASSMTAPRVVNVHVNEPAVTHLTWMLFDPNDQALPGGYSTVPGFPDSTTRPFTLQPTHFSGAGFVPGKYILRCSGLNAQHQPVVFADRDFNVLSSDMTTGTALATTHGRLTFTKYRSTNANPPATPRYSVEVEIQFLPDTSVNCADVSYIQIGRTIDNEGRSQHHTVNPEQNARQTPLAWSLDRVAGAPSPFYISDRNPATGAVTDNPGWGQAGHGGASPAAATLIDRPSWNQINNASFETCAICRSGANKGQTYGCATWGYTANSSGQVTLMPRGFRQMPSDQFEEARAAWNTWRTGVAAATRPEEAPTLTRP
jgi:hypothetical protein